MHYVLFKIVVTPLLCVCKSILVVLINDCIGT